MKEYEDQLSQLKKENFNLKLRIYFLEERMGHINGADDKEDPVKKNIELKVWCNASTHTAMHILIPPYSSLLMNVG
jgi:hypothetical protein